MDEKVIGGRYAVLARIGMGGMASVHLGRQVGVGGFSRLVAIKRLHAGFADEADFISMFLDEARLVARVRHPNVVQTIDVVASEGELAIVMEFVEGLALSQLLRTVCRFGANVPPTVAATIAVGILHGLQAAHDAKDERGQPLGIVHRDVSPQNVMIGSDGTVRVLDFGVAKAAARLQSSRVGQLKGKVPYMAPEQLQGFEVDRRSDVYGTGVVLWEMLAGRRLFASNNDAAVIPKVMAGAPAPSQVRSSISPEVDALVMRALALVPENRFPSARAMADEIERTMTLAPAREVADWIAAIGGNRLAEQAARIAAMEAETPVESAADVGRIVDEIRTEARRRRTSSVGRTSSMGLALVRSAAPPGSVPTPPPAAAVVTTKHRRALWLGGAALSAVVLSGAWGFVRSLSASPEREATATGAPILRLSAAAAEKERPARATEPCPAGMLRIPGGPFFMGAENGLALEKPVHHVTLDSYCIDQFEVTVEEYKACSDHGECRRAGLTNRSTNITDDELPTLDALCNARNPTDRAHHPINCVAWEQAARYCRVQGARLPTEAEWEYAARGPDGRAYPWGDDPPSPERLNACGSECVDWGKKNGVNELAMYAGADGWPSTSPVGSFPAGQSRFGLQDTAGNVWEWVADRFAPYTADDQTNPTGTSAEDDHVLRGGAWNGADPAWVRPTFRFHAAAETRSYGIGFRCAL